MSRAGLEFGVILGDVPTSTDPRAHWSSVLAQVEAAQRAGFTSICLGQHFLYRSFRWLQPIPVLARLAAETEPHVRLVTSVLVVPLHHPVALAEQLATLDVVTEGRLVVGAGAGYVEGEFTALGVPYAQRFARLEEALGLIDLLWSRDVVDFRGRFWAVEGVTPHLRPVQRPRPPIWVGATEPVGIRRAARVGDGWLARPGATFAELARGREVLDAERAKLGLARARVAARREIVLAADRTEAIERYRRLAADRYLAYAQRGHRRLAEEQPASSFAEWAGERAVLGSPDDCARRLADLASSGIGPVIVRPAWPGMTDREVDMEIDRLGREVLPAFRPGG